MSVQELAAAVVRLSPDELARFVQWLDEDRADEWVQQIEADAPSGRLDALGREADADIATGRERPLP